MGNAIPAKLKLGMSITKRSDIFTTERVDKNGKRQKRAMTGTVIYIHPKGRFHTVEYVLKHGQTIRESFWGVAQ